MTKCSFLVGTALALSAFAANSALAEGAPFMLSVIDKKPLIHADPALYPKSDAAELVSAKAYDDSGKTVVIWFDHNRAQAEKTALELCSARPHDGACHAEEFTPSKSTAAKN